MVTAQNVSGQLLLQEELTNKIIVAKNYSNKTKQINKQNPENLTDHRKLSVFKKIRECPEMRKCFNKSKYTYIGIKNDVSEENLIT